MNYFFQIFHHEVLKKISYLDKLLPLMVSEHKHHLRNLEGQTWRKRQPAWRCLREYAGQSGRVLDASYFGRWQIW